MLSNGGLVGSLNAPTTAAASGVWSVTDHALYKKAASWPKEFIPVTSNLQLFLWSNDSESYPGSGTTWTDLSGNNNDFTLVNGPTTSNGIMNFDGANDYAQGGSALLGLAYSVVVLFRIENISGREDWLFHQYAGGGGRLINDIHTSGTLRQFIGGSALYGSTTIQTNTWYCAVFQRTSSGYGRIYLNAVVDGEGQQNTTTPDQTNNQIGGYTGVNNLVRWFDGDIPLVAVYDRELTALEVVQIYNWAAQQYSF